MYNNALNILKIIENLGYKAYIIGGYPRDLYLNRNTFDIDICTNMPTNLIKEKFKIVSSYDELSSFKIDYENNIFEITSFRIEDTYLDRRKPSEITLTDSFEEDLKRRDFIINTLAIDWNGNYIDLLNAKKDLDSKIIKVVGDINKKLSEDPLRIIRAIRFKFELDFNLDKELENYIINNTELLNYVSDYHLQKELNKIKDNEVKMQVINYLKKLTNTDFLV